MNAEFGKDRFSLPITKWIRTHSQGMHETRPDPTVFFEITEIFASDLCAFMDPGDPYSQPDPKRAASTVS